MPIVKGTASVEDSRALNKALKQTKFPKHLAVKISDWSKIQRSVIVHWMEQKITTLLGFEDEIVCSTAVNLFLPPGDDSSSTVDIDPRKAQIDLAGFLGDDDAAKFASELWEMILDASQQPTGIPRKLLEEKKKELAAKQEQQRIAQQQESMKQQQQQQTDRLRIDRIGLDSDNNKRPNDTAPPVGKRSRWGERKVGNPNDDRKHQNDKNQNIRQDQNIRNDRDRRWQNDYSNRGHDNNPDRYRQPIPPPEFDSFGRRVRPPQERGGYQDTSRQHYRHNGYEHQNYCRNERRDYRQYDNNQRYHQPRPGPYEPRDRDRYHRRDTRENLPPVEIARDLTTVARHDRTHHRSRSLSRSRSRNRSRSNSHSRSRSRSRTRSRSRGRSRTRSRSQSSRSTISSDDDRRRSQRSRRRSPSSESSSESSSSSISSRSR